jgi:D-alanine transaminase
MKYERFTLLNGEFIDSHNEEPVFNIEERGVQFGDGVYEVVRIYNGVPYTLTEHLNRFYRSLNEVKLNLPWEKETLSEHLKHLLSLNDFLGDGIIYFQATRGNAPRNHLFPTPTKPNLYAYIKKFDRPINKLSTGVNVSIEDDIRWLRCDIKSLNLLPNVLAKQTAFDKGCFEALLHRNGVITECSSSNFYIIKNNTVITHPTDNLILNGITRQQVKDLCNKNHIPFIEKEFNIDDVFSADESFLTSTTSEVMPIVAVNEREIGNGCVGELTKKIQNMFASDIGCNN